MSKIYEVGFSGWTRVEAKDEVDAAGIVMDALNRDYLEDGEDGVWMKDLDIDEVSERR